MTKTIRYGVLMVAIAALGQADTLRLKSGRTIDGDYEGGNSRQVRFTERGGSTQYYSVQDVAGVDFGTSYASESTFGNTTNAPGNSSASQRPVFTNQSNRADRQANRGRYANVTIPKDTRVSVRTIDAIDTKDATPGARFDATIAEPVVVNGAEVIPMGADAKIEVVRVQQGGKLSGQSELALRLAEITVNGRVQQLETAYAELKSESESKNTAVKTGIGAAVGAVIGAAVGGGKGAAIGAATGAGAGVAWATLKGSELKVPSETVLTFDLVQPLTVN